MAEPILWGLLAVNVGWLAINVWHARENWRKADENAERSRENLRQAEATAALLRRVRDGARAWALECRPNAGISALDGPGYALRTIRADDARAVVNHILALERALRGPAGVEGLDVGPFCADTPTSDGS